MSCGNGDLWGERIVLFVDYCNEIHNFDVDIEFCNNHNCDDDVNIECLLGLKSSVWERLSIDLMPLNRWFELMILIDVKWFVENFWSSLSLRIFNFNIDLIVWEI